MFRHPCLIFILIGFVFSNQCMSQSDEDTFNKYFKINSSYVFGGQIYNDDFLYNPGYTIQLSHGYNVSKGIFLGLGSGFINLKDHQFVPVFIEITGDKKKKSNTPFIKFQGGYSFAFDKSAIELKNYDLSGGIYVNMGLGHRIELNDSFSLLFECSYCHQASKMEYQLFNDNNYTQAMNYDYIMLSVGLIIL